MKAIELIEEAREELKKLKTSKHIRMAMGHLQKAVVQIGIHDRMNKILAERKKEEGNE